MPGSPPAAAAGLPMVYNRTLCHPSRSREPFLLQLFAIAGAGALGAVARFWLSSGVYRLLGRDFPWGTLVVNLLGAFLMGLMVVLLLERTLMPAWGRSAILIGFLGAFTTFSTFSFETIALVEQGEPLRAMLNISVSVSVGLLACWAGGLVARAL